MRQPGAGITSTVVFANFPPDKTQSSANDSIGLQPIATGRGSGSASSDKNVDEARANVEDGADGGDGSSPSITALEDSEYQSRSEGSTMMFAELHGRK